MCREAQDERRRVEAAREAWERHRMAAEEAEAGLGSTPDGTSTHRKHWYMAGNPSNYIICNINIYHINILIVKSDRVLVTSQKSRPLMVNGFLRSHFGRNAAIGPIVKCLVQLMASRVCT